MLGRLGTVCLGQQTVGLLSTSAPELQLVLIFVCSVECTTHYTVERSNHSVKPYVVETEQNVNVTLSYTVCSR